MWMQLNQFIRSYQWHEVLLEMAVIWIGVYLVFRFLRGTRGAGIIKGFALLLVIVTVLVWLLGDAFSRLEHIYERFFALLAILLIVVFQPELRQAMIRLGDARWFRTSREDTDRVVKDVSNAVQFLSKSQFGALIAIERNIKLGGLIEGGQELDARLSARLLQSIFWPNSPLHDLGVVIRGERILAAGVQFPLVEEGTLPQHFGSRHRAAAGLSMETDCIVVIVSEETGAISLAERGKIDYDLPREDFPRLLGERLENPSTLLDFSGQPATTVDGAEDRREEEEPADDSEQKAAKDSKPEDDKDSTASSAGKKESTASSSTS
ncbi:MAG: TIGR00159 family protein [Phycisphaerales bacterium]|nr:MAG: TIGR00159 family protein [Phycisphaerales bacterium]